MLPVAVSNMIESPPAATTSCPPTSRALTAARRLLGCSHLAEDALQEALLALWQQPAPPPNPEAWLCTAVVLRARQLRRCLRRRHHHENCATADCPHVATCDNPLHHAYAHELEHRLHKASSALPPAQQAPLQLWRSGAGDYSDIARNLRLPIGTVRSRLHRARRELLRALPADERGALHPSRLE